MADRRTDEGPLVPRRSLGASKQEEAPASRPTLTERVAAAIASAQEEHASSRASRSSHGSSGPAASSAPAYRERPEAGGPPPAAPAQRRPRGTRKARLRVVRVDPWSVMKIAFMLAIAFGIVTVVAVAVVWSVLGAAGVWESINNTVADVVGGETGATFDVRDYIGTSRVLGFTMVVAAVDVILITAIATLGAFLYNLAAALLGGLEVTLAEDDR